VKISNFAGENPLAMDDGPAGAWELTCSGGNQARMMIEFWLEEIQLEPQNIISPKSKCHLWKSNGGRWKSNSI
jgi:hypothetical protein